MTITKKRYIELMRAEEVLNRLEAGGVDNWEWYGESLNPEEEPILEEFVEMLDKTLKETDEIS